MHQLLRLGATFAFGFLVACGGDGAGAGPVSMATAEDGCRAECQHRIDCGTTAQPLAECTAACAAEVTGVIREDVFLDVVDCRTALACGANDDGCETCTPTASHTTYEARCRAVFGTCLDPAELDGACSVTPTPGGGDAGSFCYFATPILDEMVACLPTDAVCGTALACLQGVLEAHGIN